MNIPYYNFELHVMQNNEADLVHHEIARNVESADTFTSQSKAMFPPPPTQYVHWYPLSLYALYVTKAHSMSACVILQKVGR